MIDKAYLPLNSDQSRNLGFGLDPQEKETLGLFALSVLHAPLFFISPGFTLGVWFSIVAYYNLHKMSHIWPGWAKKWMPWHYDHHMGKNQDANWCVTFPLWDVIMRTREKSK